MGEIIHFSPRAANDAQANLTDFIELCRTALNPFGRKDVSFDSNAWRIYGLTATGNAMQYLYFTRLGQEVRGSKGRPAIVTASSAISEPFLSFSKAMISYMHGVQPTTSIGERWYAFRYLEAALREVSGTSDPTIVTPQVLDHACGMLVKDYKHRTAHSRGNYLEHIYRFMTDLGLVRAPAIWNCPIRPPQQTRNRVGQQFDITRAKKLPDPAALEAIAHIFTSTTTDPTEIATSSLCALMICSPDRASEALRIPLDCLIADWQDPDTGERGTGLRWFPLKGGAPLVKTVIPSMRSIAVRAADQLRRLSEPARVVARWYEANPGKVYIPKHLEHLRSKKELSIFELHQLLFGGGLDSTASERQRTSNWVKQNNVPEVRRVGKKSAGKPVRYFSFKDVERTILTQLPEGFPVMDRKTGMRYSEALCISRRGEFNSKASNVPYQCLVMPITYGTFAGALKTNCERKSIFEKRGFKGADGEYLFITSHMLRHYLNTLVRQDGRLTEKEIADWSGRRDIKQNTVYDHTSDRDKIDHLRRAVGDKTNAIGPLADIDNRILVTRDEFANLKIVTAHTTELGYCIHDFAMLPCQMHADHINCNEHAYIKGDLDRERNLRQLQAETHALLDLARQALAEEEYGADEWVKHQEKTLHHVNSILRIMDDPTVPGGAVIQLEGVIPPSRLAQAAEKRGQHTSLSESIRSLDDVRALLADTPE